MNIILLRHATRNFTLGDVPLNDFGVEQSEKLGRDPLLLKSQSLFSSPKKRAQMTIEPLSNILKLPVVIDDKLDQMMSHESEAEFNSRVQSFLNELLSTENKNQYITICSHSDWLTTALNLIPTDALDIKHYMFACAEYLHFKINDGLWVIQD